MATGNRLLYGGQLILQLHSWDDEGHPNLVDRDKGTPGHGVLIWFEVSDFENAVEQACALDAEVVQGPAANPNSDAHELWLSDPDGYTIVLSNRA